jgi:hypothetical protein
MDRRFDYTQKVLLAVEFADDPRRLQNMPASYAVFKRLTIPVKTGLRFSMKAVRPSV